VVFADPCRAGAGGTSSLNGLYSHPGLDSRNSDSGLPPEHLIPLPRIIVLSGFRILARAHLYASARIRTRVNKPPADVPDPSGWHHTCGVDPLE
jgi:hypothetical protein